MTDWHDMGEAPTDGTFIEGRNAKGETAPIQCRRIHPKCDLTGWFLGDQEKQGHWIVSKCFYPVKWRHLPCP